MSRFGRFWLLGVLGALGIVALVSSCAPPATPAAPDPLIECGQVAGSITYTPPATNSGADITIDAQPGTTLSQCVDHTGAGVTSGELTLSVVLPGYLCGTETVGQDLGSGTGAIAWNDGSVSPVEGRIRSGPYDFIVELTLSGGRWSGAIGSVPMLITSADGACTPARPATTATLQSNGPIAFHASTQPLLPPRTDLAQIDGSGTTTCAVMTDGTATCWGSNSHGQLGNVLLGPGSNTVLPVAVTGLAGITSIAVGTESACALLSDGTVRCWGANERGQLGNGTTFDSTVPVAVAGLSHVRAVTVGSGRACALLDDGTVSCWGDLAAAGGATSSTPVAVAGLTGVQQVSAGSFHVCALMGDGTVRCWGSNEFGQLGNGTRVDSATPVQASGYGGATQVSAGSAHTCALDSVGRVACWGFNRYGQLGQGYANDQNPGTTPSLVLGMLVATSIDLGGEVSCALVVGGAVSCWGLGEHGSLGNGVTVDSTRASLAMGLTGASQVSAGGHTCAILPGGRADCWGENFAGELGDGTTVHRSVPGPVIDP